MGRERGMAGAARATSIISLAILACLGVWAAVIAGLIAVL